MSRHLVRLMAISMAASALLVAVPIPAPTLASGDYDPASHTITLHVLFHGPGASQTVTDRWVQVLQQWYAGDPFAAAGLKVRIDAQQQLQPQDACPAGRHCILVLTQPPGTFGVSGCSGQNLPVESYWSGGHSPAVMCLFYKGSTDATIVHEFGHLLGLPDRYTMDATGNVVHDPNRPDDIMNYAEHGKLQQRDDVDRLLKALGAASPSSSDPLDKPFAHPQYLVHATGHGTTSGGVADDFYTLLNSEPDANGHYTIADGSGGTIGYASDFHAGPFMTPRAVCAAAAGRGVAPQSWTVAYDYNTSFTCP